MLRSLFPRFDEAGLAEHGKMLGSRLLGNVDFVRDLSDRARASTQQAKDLDAPRLAEGFESERCLLLRAFHKCLLV